LAALREQILVSRHFQIIPSADLIPLGIICTLPALPKSSIWAARRRLHNFLSLLLVEKHSTGGVYFLKCN